MRTDQSIETERLLIRPFHTGDAPFVLSLLNTPGWLRFIGDKQARTVADAEKYLRHSVLSSYEKHGFGLLHVSLGSDQRPLGMCGLIKRDTLEHVDIGFAFLPEENGKGYALESALAVLAYAKDTLSIGTISAITLPENNSSIRLLEKAGLRFDKMIYFPDSDEELMLFIAKL